MIENVVPQIVVGAPHITPTPEFNFVWGRFGAGTWKIPYFAISMTLADAAKHLALATDIPGSQAQDFALEELFQRDINWDRVEQKIAPWLTDRTVPQFFSALTVTLIPFDNRTGKVAASFANENADWHPPIMSNLLPSHKVVEVGPVTAGYWQEWSEFGASYSDFGRMSWNKDQAFAVAIDGQHRLAALKKIYDDTQDNQGDPIRAIRIPVNILIFDDRLGFEASHGHTDQPIKLMRRIFIDLNKHTEKVSRGRQLLLEDTAPEAVCLRTLIGDRVTEGIDMLFDASPRLPLALVDWHSEDAKFQVGPYLATVLNLDAIVTNLLKISQVSSPIAYSAIAKQIENLTKSLSIDLSESQERCMADSDFGKPFHFSEAELQQIASHFSCIWANPIAYCFNNFAPYRDFVHLRKATESLTIDWQTWFRLKSRAQSLQSPRAKQELAAFQSQLQLRPDQPLAVGQLEGCLDKFEQAKENSLAFTVVFQKALFSALGKFQAEPQTKVLNREPEDDVNLQIEDLETFDSEIEDYQSNPERTTAPGADMQFESRQEDVLELSEGALRLAEATQFKTQVFIRSLNALVENSAFLELNFSHKQVGKVRKFFWSGSLRSAEGNIFYTEVAATRAQPLLILCAGLVHHRDVLKTHLDFDQFWDAVWFGSGQTKFDKYLKARITEAQGGLAERILAEEDLELAGNEERALDEIRERLEWAWNV